MIRLESLRQESMTRSKQLKQLLELMYNRTKPIDPNELEGAEYMRLTLDMMHLLKSEDEWLGSLNQSLYRPWGEG